MLLNKLLDGQTKKCYYTLCPDTTQPQRIGKGQSGAHWLTASLLFQGSLGLVQTRQDTEVALQVVSTSPTVRHRLFHKDNQMNVTV